jgi:hypothetical protein
MIGETIARYGIVEKLGVGGMGGMGGFIGPRISNSDVSWPLKFLPEELARDNQ